MSAEDVFLWATVAVIVITFVILGVWIYFAIFRDDD